MNGKAKNSSETPNDSKPENVIEKLLENFDSLNENQLELAQDFTLQLINERYGDFIEENLKKSGLLVETKEPLAKAKVQNRGPLKREPPVVQNETKISLLKGVKRKRIMVKTQLIKPKLKKNNMKLMNLQRSQLNQVRKPKENILKNENLIKHVEAEIMRISQNESHAENPAEELKVCKTAPLPQEKKTKSNDSTCPKKIPPSQIVTRSQRRI